MPSQTRPRSKSSRSTSSARRLERYHAKRNLKVSGEPDGGTVAASSRATRRFVIQKHDATRLHYDFRLEMDGVYRSWAVPKGLPTEPGQRSLAVEVEDHPLEYGTFEGIIPAGNYGAGTVMLWDRGYYTVSGVEPEVAYREGKIHLALAGQKSVGEWTLVRLRPRPGEKSTNWLLIRNHSPEHSAAMAGAQRDVSALSHRTMEQIASGEPAAAAKRAARSAPPARAKTATTKRDRGSAKAKPLPARETPAVRSRSRRSRAAGAQEHLPPATFIAPMKARAVDAIPPGEWRLEIKLDGYRAIAVINRGAVELWSRNHKPLTDDYPEIVAALEKLPCANAVVDGEIVALDEQGRSRFQLLQNRDTAARPPIVYYVFDLLHHDGRSLLERPLEERQLTLEVLIGKRRGPVQVSPVFQVTADALLARVREQELEGIIAKAAGSPYEPDRRSGRWLKCKVHGEQEFVIGGFTPPKNSRPHLGAILVGYYEGDELMYAGKVGSGFDTRRLRELHAALARRRIAECPFSNLPSARKSRFGAGMTRAAMREVTWVKPELVAAVQFTEWTSDGSLRHPVFLGLREDKSAREVVREPGPGSSAA